MKRKSKTAKSDHVKFLGMTIVKGTVAISKVALNKAMEKVKELIARGTNLSIEQAIENYGVPEDGKILNIDITSFRVSTPDDMRNLLSLFN